MIDALIRVMNRTAAVARAVRVDLVADPTRFIRGMRQAQSSSQRFTQHTSRAGSALKARVRGVLCGGGLSTRWQWVAPPATQPDHRPDRGRHPLHPRAAGLTAKGFSDLAKEISKTAAVDDDLIRVARTSSPLTKIRAGGPDQIFERATQAAVDMTAALNGGQVSVRA